MNPLIDIPPTTSSLISLPSNITLLGSESAPSAEQLLVRFEESVSFARSVLDGWGLALGELQYSQQNDRTVRCLLELVELRQRELQLRVRARQDLSVMQFERDKYHSFLEQAKRSLEEHSKRIGKLENQNAELTAKLRKSEAVSKREREDDRKAVNTLRTKNEHALHEIKKKEGEVARLKEQLKKNNQKVAFKNVFQVYHNLTSQVKKASNDERFTFLLERNERDLAVAGQENSILRFMLGGVRESLVEFSKWIDRQLFGEAESQQFQSQKFQEHHNLAIAKESLTNELNALIQSTKDGIVQLREINKGRSPPKRKEQPLEQPNFKRKASFRQQAKLQKASRCDPIKIETRMITSKKIDLLHNENQTPRSSHEVRDMRTQPNVKPVLKMHKVSLTDVKKTNLLGKGKSVSLLATPKTDKQDIFDDEISEVCSHDSSIISHISIEQMGQGRHDRWDVLYQDEQ